MLSHTDIISFVIRAAILSIPVILLFVASIKIHGKIKESSTFMIVVGAFMLVLIVLGDYIFIISMAMPLDSLSPDEIVDGSRIGLYIKETLYFFGILLIAIGLYRLASKVAID